jgi:hypothetical protein
MMTPDRRAKLIELAEAMADLQIRVDFGRNYPPLNNEQRKNDRAKLDAAAERLDKAMVAWFTDRFVNAQIQVCTGGGYVDPKIESTPTAARPQE